MLIAMFSTGFSCFLYISAPIIVNSAGNSSKKYFGVIVCCATRKEMQNNRIESKKVGILFVFTSESLKKLVNSFSPPMRIPKNNSAKVYLLAMIEPSMTRTRTIPVIARVKSFFNGLNL